MDRTIQEYFDALKSTDDNLRFSALQAVLNITEHKVDWVYEVWDELVARLNDENSYQRSIAILVLCNLAKSDDENRIEASLGNLLAHTRDEKFITSRQCIQNIWKVVTANSQVRDVVIDHLARQFSDCAEEKHYNLLRQDIIQSLWQVSKAEKDERILARAKELVKEEKEEKYRKKYEAILDSH